jgi:cellulose synthase/poly-beta-1,6-N-acetylglucosamine synthase-like glycosyltransferase
MMDILLGILTSLLWLIWVPLALAIGYLLLLTVAAAFTRRTLPPAHQRRTFRIVIPAHNEEVVLAPVLQRLMTLYYPRTHFEVIVVADNCTDQTAQIARSYGARVLERHDLVARGKGHALRYAFAALQHEYFDAYLVLDADTLVDPHLLTVLNRYLAAGHRIVQAHYDVLNPFESRRTTLMYIALRIFHYVRPLGRRMLGLSATLTGNGMCFAKPVIDHYAWNAFSLTEDLEYTSTLIRSGERIVFAPEAHIHAQMPVTRSQATTQRMRWEAGRLHIARRDGLRSLAQGVWQRDVRLFDWGMDLLVPPLAALVLAVIGGTTLATAALAIAPSTTTIALWCAWLGLGGALAMFVVEAMLVGQLPRQAYSAMLHAPGYILWKLWIYLLMATHRAPQQWVRTDRTRLQDE